MSAEAMGWVFRHSPFRGATFQVHLAIADSVNDLHDNIFWMARANLATKARVSGESVSNAVAALADKGYIRPEDEGMDNPDTRKRAGRPTRWRFLFPEDAVVVYETRGSGSAARSRPWGSRPSREGGSGSAATGSRLSRDVTQEDPKMSTQTQEPMSTSLTLVDVPAQEPVTVIFDAWREATGRTTRTLLDDSRTRVIRKALGLYPFEDCLDAVRGIALSAYHMGANPEGKRYAELDNCLGGKHPAARIEKFRDLYRNDGQLSPLERARNHKTGGAIVAALERMEREQESGGRALRPAGGAVPVARR